MNGQSLRGKVAVVTGASRGMGKGIARVLGAYGMTVYITGRSSRSTSKTEDYGATIEEVADIVNANRGEGIPVKCDHTNDEEVEALFKRIKREKGQLELLVNNVWGGYESKGFQAFKQVFWRQPTELWDYKINAAIRAHFMASYFATKYFFSHQKQGTIINISTKLDEENYIGDLLYTLSKKATDNLTYLMAQDFRRDDIRVPVLSLYPGDLVATEMVLETQYVNPDEKPEFTGRAVAELASDVGLMQRTGQCISVSKVAEIYGFSDR